MVSVMLLDHTVTFAAAHDNSRMRDPAVLRERSKVKLIPDPELERLMPLRVAIVELTLADGARLKQRVDNVRGTPENPITRHEVAPKALDLIAPVLGATQCANLIQTIFELESIKDILYLRPLLRRS